MAAALVVTCETDEQCQPAAALARQLGLPFSFPPAGEYDASLVLTPERLELRLLRPIDSIRSLPGPIHAEFVKGGLDYRRRHGGGRRQPLGRAVGLKPHHNPLVFDATAGLGRDGFILAHLGCRVHLVERSPVIAALLADGLKRAAACDLAAPVVERLSLEVGDSRKILAGLDVRKRPEVIYLDPMFPHRTKSSLVKKEMRLLRLLVGEDPDDAELLDMALQQAGYRVVVKRPRLAPAIAGPPPTMTIDSKNSRYDVYLR